MSSSSSTRQKQKLLGFLALSITISLFALTSLGNPLFEDLENRSWDWRVRLISDPMRADRSIKLIVVDQDSLDFLEEEYSHTWPIPRAFYSAVIRFLERGGARGVGFDLVFSESSAHSVDEDNELAQSISKLPVVSAVATGLSRKKINREKLELLRTRQAQSKGVLIKALDPKSAPNFESATLPVPQLLERSHAFGSVFADQDRDGIFRRYPLGGFIEDIPILSLAFALHQAAGGVVPQHKSREGALTEEQNLLLNFYGPQNTYDAYPIAKVIQSQAALEEGVMPALDPHIFKDAWVFVGVWAPGLGDLRPTPLDEKYRGVEIHAVALDNLLHTQFIKTAPFWSVFIYTVGAIWLGVAAVLYAVRLQVALVVSLALLYVAIGVTCAIDGYWIPMAIPMISTILAVLGAFILQYRLEGRERRFVKDAFRFYVSPAVIEKILADPTRLTLGGDKRDLTIFFSDIEGFTRISESLEVSKLVQLLNDFLSEMTEIILACGGTVDKYVGDAIVAFWNAPLTVESHAARAVEAALKCQARIKEIAPELREKYGVTVRMRIGLNTGVVSVGNFGSKARFNYTVIGDAANLASRLEGANKYFGTSILLADSTYRALHSLIACRKVADIKVVGKNEVVSVFEPWQGESEDLKRYEQGLQVFEAGDLAQARSLFEGIMGDSVVKAYMDRIDRELAAPDNGVVWSPVWNLTEK